MFLCVAIVLSQRQYYFALPPEMNECANITVTLAHHFLK